MSGCVLLSNRKGGIAVDAHHPLEAPLTDHVPIPNRLPPSAVAAAIERITSRSSATTASDGWDSGEDWDDSLEDESDVNAVSAQFETEWSSQLHQLELSRTPTSPSGYGCVYL